MKHRVQKKRLGRISPQRKALVRSLLTSLLVNGRVETTESKAKVLVSEFDSLVGSVRQKKEKREQIRRAKDILFTEEAQRNLFEKVLAEKPQSSGLVRTSRLGPRKGDGAPMIQVELYS
jgi:large subunit ribosomal protein L17